MATNPKPTTLAELQKSRELIVQGPSGHTYKVRPINLERHALEGGLPAKLRSIALAGADGIQSVFAADDATVSEHGRDVLGYIDGLVADVIVEPSMRADKPKQITDPRTGDAIEIAAGAPDPEKLEMLPPVDYRWATAIALGEEDRDGEGRRLWGREPLSRWATFREEHGCDEDCESCQRVRDRFSAAALGH